MIARLRAALHGAEGMALAGSVAPAAAVVRAAVSDAVVQVIARLRAAFDGAEGPRQAGAVADAARMRRAAVGLAVVEVPSGDGAAFNGAERAAGGRLGGCLLRGCGRLWRGNLLGKGDLLLNGGLLPSVAMMPAVGRGGDHEERHRQQQGGNLWNTHGKEDLLFAKTDYDSMIA